MLDKRNAQNSLGEFVAKVKDAVKGDRAGQDIQHAVEAFLQSYGIQTPVKK